MKKITLAKLCTIASDLFNNSKVKSFVKFGALYVNTVFGYMIPTNQKIIKEIKTTEFKFPIEEEEEITITMWPNGSHYHLKSSVGREFEKKFNSWKAAKNHALKFVSKKDISFKKPFVYMTQGD